MSAWEIIRYLFFRTIGNFLLLFSIFGLAFTFGPSLFYEAKYQIAKVRGVHFSVAEDKGQAGQNNAAPSPIGSSPLGQIVKQQKEAQALKDQGGFRSVLVGPKEQILIPKDPLFSLLIPKVGANEKVFPNVDPNNEAEFLPLLYKGVAHAKGSVFPGITGTTYIFAHSSDNFWDVGRYNAVFYLLKDLVMGDDIVVFFENRRYNYTVSGSKVVDANDASALTNSQGGSGQQLILQTCWPPGTTWKRLLVFAKPK